MMWVNSHKDLVGIVQRDPLRDHFTLNHHYDTHSHYQLRWHGRNIARIVFLLHSFGYSGAEYFTYFNYSCSGDELTLSSCDALSSINCTTSDLLSAVAADCGNGITSGVNEVWKEAGFVFSCTVAQDKVAFTVFSVVQDLIMKKPYIKMIMGHLQTA